MDANNDQVLMYVTGVYSPFQRISVFLLNEWSNNESISTFLCCFPVFLKGRHSFPNRYNFF